MLVDPRSGQPFYVGKGTGNRCYSHENEAKYYVKRKSLKLGKIRKLLSLGMSPVIVKVEDNVSDKQAIDLECFLIAEMRDSGIPLTNMTDGGDGAQGYKHTEEHKDKMRQLFVGRVFTSNHLQKMRKPKSPGGRINIALARNTTSYRPSEETKRKTSEALKGRPSPRKNSTLTAEARAKISLMNKGLVKPKVQCPHCPKLAAAHTAKRWHFNNCKEFTNV